MAFKHALTETSKNNIFEGEKRWNLLQSHDALDNERHQCQLYFSTIYYDLALFTSYSSSERTRILPYVARSHQPFHIKRSMQLTWICENLFDERCSDAHQSCFHLLSNVSCVEWKFYRSLTLLPKHSSIMKWNEKPQNWKIWRKIYDSIKRP